MEFVQRIIGVIAFKETIIKDIADSKDSTIQAWLITITAAVSIFIGFFGTSTLVGPNVIALSSSVRTDVFFHAVTVWMPMSFLFVLGLLQAATLASFACNSGSFDKKLIIVLFFCLGLIIIQNLLRVLEGPRSLEPIFYVLIIFTTFLISTGFLDTASLRKYLRGRFFRVFGFASVFMFLAGLLFIGVYIGVLIGVIPNNIPIVFQLHILILICIWFLLMPIVLVHGYFIALDSKVSIFGYIKGIIISGIVSLIMVSFFYYMSLWGLSFFLPWDEV